MSVKGILLEHFSAPTQTETAGTPQSCTRHALFHSFFSGDIKHNSATIISHIKRIIGLLKQHNIMPNTLSTIGGNTYEICNVQLHNVHLQTDVNFVTGFYIIIDRGISAPGHGREVLDGLNAIEKRFIFQLISTMQLPGEIFYDTQIVMHTGTRTSDVSLYI